MKIKCIKQNYDVLYQKYIVTPNKTYELDFKHNDIYYINMYDRLVPFSKDSFISIVEYRVEIIKSLLLL